MIKIDCSISVFSVLLGTDLVRSQCTEKQIWRSLSLLQAASLHTRSTLKRFCAHLAYSSQYATRWLKAALSQTHCEPKWFQPIYIWVFKSHKIRSVAYKLKDNCSKSFQKSSKRALDQQFTKKRLTFLEKNQPPNTLSRHGHLLNLDKTDTLFRKIIYFFRRGWDLAQCGWDLT